VTWQLPQQVEEQRGIEEGTIDSLAGDTKEEAACGRPLGGGGNNTYEYCYVTERMLILLKLQVKLLW
jgi:hypothetical protein